MVSAVETAVDTYVRAWDEPDPAVRAAMVEACFAENGRIVAPRSEFLGRAALTEMMTRVLADPMFLRVRIVSAIDIGKSTFRYRAAIEQRDGTKQEFLDAGMIDDSGRIALILVFAEPLGAPA
jgi:hypothetical protein